MLGFDTDCCSTPAAGVTGTEEVAIASVSTGAVVDSDTLVVVVAVGVAPSCPLVVVEESLDWSPVVDEDCDEEASSAAFFSFSASISFWAAANATETFDSKAIALREDAKRAGGSGDRSGLDGAAFAAEVPFEISDHDAR